MSNQERSKEAKQICCGMSPGSEQGTGAAEGGQGGHGAGTLSESRVHNAEQESFQAKEVGRLIPR